MIKNHLKLLNRLDNDSNVRNEYIYDYLKDLNNNNNNNSNNEIIDKRIKSCIHPSIVKKYL